jgi:FAD/FMN-containing dehydrogenase
MSTQAGATNTDDLRANLRGSLLAPADPDYDEARRVWNGMIDRRPALIIRARGTADVIAAVNYARDQGLAVSVRGGGHSAAGSAVADDALMLDLSLMNGVHVDAKARRARAQGGAQWGDFDRECQVFGLASTGGVVSTTGVGGLTLGGGLGWLMAKHGLAVDNLISADVVTAEGKIVTASASENTELFWALRGGSGNFGVVTSLEFQLHEVGPIITGGLAAWPVAMARDTLSFFGDFTSNLPDELTVFLGFTGAPDGSGNIAALLAAHCGSIEDGERALQPVKAFGPPAMDMLGPIPYVAQQSMLDAAFPKGAQVYWKSTFLRMLSPEACDVLARYARELPSPMSGIVVEHFHGAVGRVAVDATAFNERSANYNVVIFAIAEEPSQNPRHRAWARGLYDELQPFSTGTVYVNYLGVDDDEARVRAAYGPNYERLTTIKRQYDPQNLFRANQNILPSS